MSSRSRRRTSPTSETRQRKALAIGPAMKSCTIAGLLLTSMLLPASAAQAPAKIPNFMEDETVAWLASGNEYIAMPAGPHPLTPDPPHPYIHAGRGGRPPPVPGPDVAQPTLH